MGQFSLLRVLPYSIDELFALVSDVESYPKFLPWITSLHAHNHTQSDTTKRFDADVAVGYKLFSERFSTRVICDPEAKTVTMNLLRGPFRRLEGQWQFTPHENGANVALKMDVDINNPIINAVFKASFDRAVEKIISLFEARAESLYR